MRENFRNACHLFHHFHLSVILTLILFHSFGTGVRTEKKDPQYPGAGTYETKTAVSINSLYSNWFFVYWNSLFPEKVCKSMRRRLLRILTNITSLGQPTTTLRRLVQLQFTPLEQADSMWSVNQCTRRLMALDLTLVCWLSLTWCQRKWMDQGLVTISWRAQLRNTSDIQSVSRKTPLEMDVKSRKR